MRNAIYMQDGRTQVVLTAENDFEKMILDKIEKGQPLVNLYRGSFYNCQGGWTRHGTDNDRSLILVLDEAAKDD